MMNLNSIEWNERDDLEFCGMECSKEWKWNGEWSRMLWNTLECCGVLTLALPASRDGLLGAAVTQLTTHHWGGRQVPTIITNGSPLAVLQDFNTTLSNVGPAPQTHQRLLWKHTGKLYWGFHKMKSMIDVKEPFPFANPCYKHNDSYQT